MCIFIVYFALNEIEVSFCLEMIELIFIILSRRVTCHYAYGTKETCFFINDSSVINK